MRNHTTGVSVPILPIAFVVLLILKLTGTVDWSWWWICSPLFALAGVYIIFVLGLVFVIATQVLEGEYR